MGKAATAARFKVGDRVWYQSRTDAQYGREPSAYQVLAVGRKWVTFGTGSRFERGRFDVETLMVDGKGYTESPIILSIERWRESREAGRAWSRFCDAVRDTTLRVPDGATPATVAQAAALLGLKLRGEP